MAKLFLEPTDTNYPVSGNGTQIFGTSGVQKVVIAAGTTGVTVDGNVEGVSLAGDISTYKFQQSGATLKIFAADGVTLVATVPVQDDADGTQLTIGTASFDVKVGATGMTVGTATVATTAGTIAPTIPVVPVVPVAVTLTAAASVDEGKTATFTIKATAPVAVDTPFTYSIPANTSIDVTDFTGSTTGTATILKGTDSITFGIQINADNMAELAQNFDVIVKDITGATVGTKNTQINDVTIDKTAPVIGAITSTATKAIASTNNIEYAENQTVAGVIGSVAATDEVGGTGVASFAITAASNPNGYFAIDNTGKISLTAAAIAAGVATNDYETAPNTFTLGVTATDVGGNTSAATNVIVGVTNVDDTKPSLAATNSVTANTNSVVLNFDEALSTASIPSASDFLVTETIGSNVANKTIGSVSINANGAVTLTLSTNLTAGSTTKVSYTPGANPLKDLVGNNANAITQQTAISDVTAPTLAAVASSPLDNATGVDVASNIVLHFSEAVKAGTGNIIITNEASAADTRTISVGDATQVTFSGSSITINPTADLLTGANYNVTMASGVVLDSIGNAFAGIPLSTTLNFATPGAASTTGQTFPLNQGADNVTGTAGDDLINGYIDNGAASFSGSLDVINGGAGVDTLTVLGQSGAVSFATVSNVEKFAVGNSSATAATVDMSAVSTETSLTAFNVTSTGGVAFSNIGAATVVLNVNGGASTATAAFDFATGSLSSATDIATLNVNGATNVVTVNNAGTGGNLETLVINATGAASTFAATSLATVTGLTTLTLNATAAFSSILSAIPAVTTINASNSTAATYLQVPASVLTYTGGTGDDTLLIAGLTTADTLNGGTGNDTLAVIAATAATNTANVTNFEKLGVAYTANFTQDLSLLPIAMNEVRVLATSDGQTPRTFALTNAQNNLVLNLEGSDASAVTSDVASVTVGLATNGAADKLTVNVGGTAGDYVLSNFAPSTSYENVIVNSQGTTANVITTISTALNNMTLTGGTALTVTAGSLVGVLDASAMTAAANVTTGTTALSVKGSTVADTISTGVVTAGTTVLEGNGGNDTLSAASATTGSLVSINGGDGNDTITGSVIAASSLVGGAGTDIINSGAVALAGNTVVTGGLGADTINLQSTSAAAHTTTLNVTAAESFATASSFDTVTLSDGTAVGSNVVTMVTGVSNATMTYATTVTVGTTAVTAGSFLVVSTSGTAAAAAQALTVYQDSNSNGIIDATDLRVNFAQTGTDTLAAAIVLTGGVNQAVITDTFV